MKLLVCIIEDFYADHVEKDLREQGYRMTELSSSGGFLRKGSTTFYSESTKRILISCSRR
ncbi:cyclic-di-AMP receptor [Bacillus sp. JCM 19041]|uniref:cyclic-di-AMP receptor n=1 Tax=Bacillus sp. JCM 19041 TaxID=1460637 RepID=UPI000A742C1F